jgi:uncharacterized membrane protein YhaH (DUF805 family)
MSTALEGAPKPGITLTEQANGRRLCRSMFIGHSVGYLLIFAVVFVGMSFFQYAGIRPVPPSNYFELYINPYAAIALASVGSLIWVDLMVRRRHDRGRSGVDAVIWLMVAFASVIIHAFADAPDIVFWVDAALGLYGLYLFVVLVILPGDRKENRYGAVPRPD